MEIHELLLVNGAAECPICLEPTSCKALPCNHPLCNECSQKWLVRKMKCPLCQQGVYGMNGTPPSNEEKGSQIVLDFATSPGGNPCHPCGRSLTSSSSPIKIHAGMTFANFYPEGVLLVRVKKGDLAQRNGFKAGMVLLSANGIKLSNHALTADLVNAASKHRKNIVFHMLKQDKNRGISACPNRGIRFCLSFFLKPAGS